MKPAGCKADVKLLGEYYEEGQEKPFIIEDPYYVSIMYCISNVMYISS